MIRLWRPGWLLGGQREPGKRPAHTAGEHDRCAHTGRQSFNHMLTVFPFTIPQSIAQHSPRWLRAAILNLFSQRTCLSYFFYYMAAGNFHFHAKTESERLTPLSFVALLELFATRHLYQPLISNPKVLTHCSAVTENILNTSVKGLGRPGRPA